MLAGLIEGQRKNCNLYELCEHIMHAVLSHTLSLSHVLPTHSVLEPSVCAASVDSAYRRKFRAMTNGSVKRLRERMSFEQDMDLQDSTTAEGAWRGRKGSAGIYV